MNAKGGQHPLRGSPDSGQADDDRSAARRRFGRLPDRIAVDDLIESEPQPPQLDPVRDESFEAIRWYGTPF